MNKLYKGIKLQLFSDSGESKESEDVAGAEQSDEKKEPQETGEKIFTQSQLDEKIQTRLERAMKKAEEDRKQAEELAKLSEKERAAKEIELKQKELDDERAAFFRERLELQTSKELDKLGLPISFTEYVIGSNAEETQTRITEFQKVWESELDKRRIDSMKGKSPQSGIASGIDKDAFNSMSYKERMELFDTNQDLYNELTK